MNETSPANHRSGRPKAWELAFDAARHTEQTEMRNILLSTLTVAALAIGVGQSGAAEFTPSVTRDVIFVDGEIVAGDDVRLLTLVDKLNVEGHKVEGIYLNSAGGNVLAGEDLAAAIYGLQVATAVYHNEVCVSICVLSFAAGKERYAFEDSRIGVHSVWMAKNEQSDEAAPEDLDSLGLTAAVARDMAYYRVPSRVITKMLTTPGNDVAWLNAGDVEGWAVVYAAEGGVR